MQKKKKKTIKILVFFAKKNLILHADLKNHIGLYVFSPNNVNIRNCRAMKPIQ